MKYLFIIILMTAGVQTYADWKTPAIREIVQTESRKHRIPERIIYNLIFAESSGRPYIKGNPIRIKVNGKRITTRAHGLMQIIPEYHYKGNKEDLLRPEINIPIGCKLLHRYLKRSKGNMVKALRLYNGQVRNKDDEYIRKILKK